MMLDPVNDGTFQYSRAPGGRLVTQSDGTTNLLVGLDRHGDLAYLLDPTTGALTDTVMFDPYGDVVATTGTTAPTVGFQGDYTDPTSNEVWMGARWYSGADAAFRSRDTVFGQLATPISLNRYTYGYANPLTYWDPDGRTPVVDGAGAGIVGHDANGTPIRANVGNDRITRHNDRIRQSEAPLNLANNRVLLPWEFDDNQFGATNPTPSTASQAAVVAANDRVVVDRQWAVLLELLTPGTIDMDPIDAECYSAGLGAMACMWDWGRAPSTLGATDFAIAMLAPVLVSQLPAMAGWAAGQAVTLGEAAAAACATRCPAITRWIANAGEETAECTMSLSNGIGWEDSIDCTLALIGARAAIKGGGGTPPPGETAGSTNDARFVYRTGSQTDNSLSDPTGVSFRDSVSSAADRSQTFGPGDKIFAVDTGLLPPDSVIFDGSPDGHVSVTATPNEIRGAILSEFPDNPLEMLRPLEDGSFRIPKK